MLLKQKSKGSITVLLLLGPWLGRHLPIQMISWAGLEKTWESSLGITNTAQAGLAQAAAPLPATPPAPRLGFREAGVVAHRVTNVLILFSLIVPLSWREQSSWLFAFSLLACVFGLPDIFSLRCCKAPFSLFVISRLWPGVAEDRWHSLAKAATA